MNRLFRFRHKPAAAPLALALALALAAGMGRAQVAPSATAPPGTRFEQRADDLALPFASPSASNPAYGAGTGGGAGALNVPPGFRISLFAENLGTPRWMTVAPNGDVFLADSANGRVLILRDADGNGQAESVNVFAAGLYRPHGLALQGDALYVADTRRVWRYPYRRGEMKPAGPAEKVTPDNALGDGQGHWTRNIAFHPDGSKFYVAIGSRGNIGEEELPRASVQEFSRDGTPLGTFASGLRNPVGIAFYPGTSDLFVTVNERDGLGEELVPDYLTHLERGGFYGWPYAYTGRHPQPGWAEKNPALVEKSLAPDVLFRSHSAPLGLVFYDGAQFPEDYRGDAFVALHGSWNAAQPRGYMVVRVPFKNARPQGHYESFVTGFWAEGVERAGVIGRPAGLAQARDGALLIADDEAGKIWRVSYEGKAP